MSYQKPIIFLCPNHRHQSIGPHDCAISSCRQATVRCMSTINICLANSLDFKCQIDYNTKKKQQTEFFCVHIIPTRWLWSQWLCNEIVLQLFSVNNFFRGRQTIDFVLWIFVNSQQYSHILSVAHCLFSVFTQSINQYQSHLICSHCHLDSRTKQTKNKNKSIKELT